MITAEFTADFTDFSAALKEAIKELNNLSAASKDAAKVADDSFKTMTSSGVQTGNTMTSIGQEALNLGKAVGIGFGVKEVIDFGKEVIEAASALAKLQAQTGISAEDLQRMQAAGAGVGVSLDTMTDGAVRLTASLGKGDKGTAAALADLNIDLEKFKAMGAHEQMATLAEAVQKVHDPLRIAADLSAIYGKGWAEQLPVLQKGFKESGDATIVWSADTVAALDGAGNAAASWWDMAQKVFGVQMANLLTNTSEAMRVLESDFKAMLAATDKLGPPPGLTPLRDGLVDVTGAVGLLNDGLDDQKTKIDADVIAQNKYNAAWGELNAAGGTWQEIAAGINAETANLATQYLAAGHSQTTVATALGLTDVEIKAVVTSVKEAEKSYNAWATAENKFSKDALDHAKELRAAENKHGVELLKDASDPYAQMKTVRDQYHDAEMKSSMDSSTYQITKIWETAAAQIEAFKGGAEERAIYADLVYSLAEQEAKGITDVMASAVDQMVGMASSGLGAVTASATAAVNQLYSMAGGSPMSASDYDEYDKTPAGIADIIRNNGKRYYEGEVMPRAGGGPVTGGSPYLVGERGPELFVPRGSGGIVPNGGNVTNLYITQPLGDPAAIARAVEDAMNSALRNSGVRLPSGA